MSKVNIKKQLIVYVAIAYGITFLMWILMAVGQKRDIDLTSFANVQMMYPACGVIVAKLMTKGKEDKLPTAPYIIILIGTVIMMAMSILSIVAPVKLPQINEVPTMDFYTVISQLVLIIIAIPVYVLFIACNKEARENAGVVRKKIGLSAWLIFVFIVLYFVRFAISLTLIGARDMGVEQAWGEWLSQFRETFCSTTAGIPTWFLMIVISLPFSFFFSWPAFFGEEYGWRYFLQPIMLKRFGNRTGILLLGLVWAVWHVGIDFLYYTTTDGPKMFITQIFTCVSVAIFFGYAYMKTQNIWVPVIMHYLNNNMVLITAATTDTDVLQNQSVSWSDLPIALVSCLVFVVFIFAKEYSTKSKEAIE